MTPLPSMSEAEPFNVGPTNIQQLEFGFDMIPQADANAGRRFCKALEAWHEDPQHL